MAETNTRRTQFEQIIQLAQHGQLAEAHAKLETLRRLHPRDANLLNLAAWLATLRGDNQRAAALYRQVLAQQPDQPQIRFNLLRAEAIIAEQAGALPKARTLLLEAAQLAPTDTALRAQVALIERQLCIFNPPPAASLLNTAAAMVLRDDPAQQAANATAWAAQQFGSIQTLPPRAIAATAPLRLGFLTSDLHEHATAYLIAELFELLDQQRFRPHIYNYGAPSDALVCQRIRAACPDFYNVNGMATQALAEAIRNDSIDILIDLKGYTRGGRLDILAYRPAPLQLHWLGFPGTLGCPFIDYFIADAVALPPTLRPHFSEKILYMPHSYQCNDRQRALPSPLPRPHYGLPESSVVFASLNQTYKLHPALLTLWADVLRAVPDSVLWLLASNTTAPDNIRQFFATQGIAPERLHFATPTDQASHLQRYHAVDVALDTFPIGGHTTTSDALWLGVPVVTLAGESFVSRVAMSLLTATGQAALIAPNRAAYQALAVALAQEPARRQAIRTALSKNRTQLPLFDSENFVKSLMSGLEMLAERQRQVLPATDCTAPKDN